MMEQSLFSHAEVAEGVFCVSAPMGEKMYLILGSEKALLIDTGMGIGSLKDYVSKLTSLPVTVLNTHGHPDHAGGNIEFPECYLHPADQEWFQKMCTPAYRYHDVEILCPEQAGALAPLVLPMGPLPLPLAPKQRFDLGGRQLMAEHLPGHTPGSICLWDERTQSFFMGDSLAGESLWMYDAYSEPLDVYYHSMCRLQGEYPGARGFFIGHAPGYLSPGMAKNTLACVRRILMCDIQGIPTKTFAGEGFLYRYGKTSVIYNPSRLYS